MGVVCWMEVVDCSSSPTTSSAESALGLRFALLDCFVAPTGNLFFAPQNVQPTTMTSAHGFLPPLLAFSMVCVAVRPGISTVLHVLQMVRFKSAESLTWLFRDTVCKSVPSCKARLDGTDAEEVVEECKVRYVAAWYRNVARACKCLFGTPFVLGGLSLAMSCRTTG